MVDALKLRKPLRADCMLLLQLNFIANQESAAA